MALKQFLVANNIKSVQLVSQRLSVESNFFFLQLAFALSVIRSFCAPAASDTKTFYQLLELLKKQFGKTFYKSLSCQTLNDARQRESNTVEKFNALLWELAIDSTTETV